MTADPSTIAEYMGQLAQALRPYGSLARRPVAELEAHLHDCTEELIEGGMPLSEAERQALARCGSPTTVAAGFIPLLDQERRRMKRILTLISLAMVFCAVWGLASVAMLNPKAELLAMTGSITVATLVGTLAGLRSGVDPSVRASAGVVLLAVGTAGACWALLGSKAEGVALVGLVGLMAILVAQGVLVLVTAARERPPLASPAA